MKRLISLIIFCLFVILNGESFAQDPVVENIIWDEGKGKLSYTLSRDSIVKIRVGSTDGPVYRTLVNLEKRSAGKSEELWQGKGELGVVDFTGYGPLHFCVDSPPKAKKDLVLSVDASKKMIQKGVLMMDEQPLSLTLDIDKKDRGWFCGNGIEIMAFLDKRLIKLERAEKLPYLLNLDIKHLRGGKGLLTLNVWSGDHVSVACKSLFISERKPAGKITYCQRHRGFWQVWTANLDGTKPHLLTKTPYDKRYPAFSPDGKRITYVTNKGELWIMEENGRNNRRITVPLHASQPRWSPDGESLAFVSYQDLYHGDSEIWEIDLETLKLKKLTNRPWFQYDPCYASNGSAILFTDGPELYAQEIRKLDFKTGDITQLTENKAYDYDMQPCYSPDCERIAYASNESGDYDIWIMDKFGRDKKNLTQNPAYDCMPQIVADGKWIFFLSDRTGSIEVWRVDIDGTHLSQITSGKKDKQDLGIYTTLSYDEKAD